MCVTIKFVCSNLCFTFWHDHIIKIVYYHTWDLPQIQIPSNQIMPVNWWLQITLWQHNKGKLDFFRGEDKLVGSSVSSELSEKHLQNQSLSTSLLYLVFVCFFFLILLKPYQGQLMLEAVLLLSSLDNLPLVSMSHLSFWWVTQGNCTENVMVLVLQFLTQH